jgi:hypothetical protein
MVPQPVERSSEVVESSPAVSAFCGAASSRIPCLSGEGEDAVGREEGMAKDSRHVAGEVDRVLDIGLRVFRVEPLYSLIWYVRWRA